MKFIRWIRRPSGVQHQPATNKAQVMELNPSQTSALIEFRKRVEHLTPSHLQPDHELIRWLIARNYNLDKAEAMLLKSLEWRKTYEIDTILSYDAPEVLKKYYGVGMTGVDKAGFPVWIVPYGSVDVKGILQSAASDDYIRYTVQVLEKGQQILKRDHNDRINRQSVIFDLDQFSLRHFTWKPVIDVVGEIIQVHEANYPEMLRKAYVINAPLLFQVLYAAIKPFMGVETTGKVSIYGTTGWKEAILEDIPEDQLPVHYGGTMRDPDGNPKCHSMICYGGEVPKSYYLKNKKAEQLPTRSGDFETLMLPSSGKKTFEFDVPQAGPHIRWEFETDDFDIGFGITRENNGKEDILIPLQRVNSQIVAEEGTLVCTEPGLYKITFDNEFSYVRSKNIRYTLKLMPLSAVEHTKF